MNLTFNSFKNQKSFIFYFWNFSFRHSRFRQKAVTAESGFPKNGTFTSWVRKQISPTERKRLSNAGTDSKFFFFSKIRRKNNFSSNFFLLKIIFFKQISKIPLNLFDRAFDSGSTVSSNSNLVLKSSSLQRSSNPIWP